MRSKYSKHSKTRREHKVQRPSRDASTKKISKLWNPIFSMDRGVQDRPFRETVEESRVELGLLTAFLQHTNASGFSWDVDQVHKFCNDTTPIIPSRIWLDHRITSSDLDIGGSDWVSSTELGTALVEHSIVRTHNAIRRRLLFAPILSRDIITTLIETASWYEAQTLSPAVRQHIAGETSIRVSLDYSSFQVFRLEFHLPYLLLEVTRDGDKEAGIDGQGKKPWSDLSFLPLESGDDQRPGRYSIYESQTTVVVSGADHYDWYGYAFGNPGPRDAFTEEYEQDDGNDADDGDDNKEDDGLDGNYFEEVEDFFATAGCEEVMNSAQVIWDPRLYFLQTLQFRLAAVVKAHENLVHTLEAGVKRWEREHLATNPGLTSDVRDRNLWHSLDSITKMTKLFDELCERFTKANKAWERFDGPCGDVLYFTNDLGCAAENILHRIRESFEKLADLELTLTRLQRTCERSREDLALLFTYESHGMNRRMTGLNSHVVELTESASKLAEKGQQVAEDTSRATRVNVQMLMVTTAIIIALQYFCSERALFAFERNVRTFWISIVVLIPSLLLLTFVLHILDQFKVVFTDRLKGRIEKATLPVMSPPSPA